MDRFCRISFLIALIALGCSEGTPPVNISWEAMSGVWANGDCELVQTGRFAVWFERDGTGVLSSLTALHRQGDSVFADTRAMILLDSSKSIFAAKAKDVLTSDDVLMDIDSTGKLSLPVRQCLIKPSSGGLALVCDADTVAILSADGNQLTAISPNGVHRTLRRIETIAPVPSYEMPKASAQTIGACLQTWPSGVRALKFNDTYTTGITITTNEHAYVFSYGGMIYCRAARIRSDNRGTVFAQNIRLMYKPGEFTSWMAPQNDTLCRSGVEINDSLFQPGACVYAPGSIYWSLKRFDDTTIVVNGCGGEDYVTARPVKTDPQLLEWFAFREYAAGGKGH
jgi:hypothetical protein